MPIQPIKDAAVQVRVVGANQQLHTKLFSFAKLGGRDKAYALARKEEARLIKEFGTACAAGFLTRPLPTKKSGERVGVTLYLSVDRRRLDEPAYWTFGVNWTDESGKHRSRQFQVGRCELVTAADIRFARKVANAFRSEWEDCVLKGRAFKPERYKNWKSPEWSLEGQALSSKGAQ